MPGTDNGFQADPSLLIKGASKIDECANSWESINQDVWSLGQTPLYFNDINQMLGTDQEYMTTWQFWIAISTSAYKVIGDLGEKLLLAAYRFHKADAHGASVINSATK